VTAAAPDIRVIVPSDRDVHPLGAAVLIACAVVDAVAAGLLLFDAPLAPPLAPPFKSLAVALLHGIAVLLVCGLPRARPSRRWLCVTAVMAVPLVGVAVAGALSFTRGRGSIAMGRRRKSRPGPTLTIDAVQRLGSALSPYDALGCGDAEQRRGALSGLSRRGDPGAIVLLRRAAAGDDPDLALSAALVLDEIGERTERELDRVDSAEVRDGTR
jgi:hypothetical protein